MAESIASAAHQRAPPDNWLTMPGVLPDLVCFVRRRHGQRIAVDVLPGAILCRPPSEFIGKGRCADEADSVELILARDRQVVDLSADQDWKRLTENVRRGLSAVQLSSPGDHNRSLFISPTDSVATNRSFQKQLQAFAADAGLSIDAARTGGVVCEEFTAEQFLICRRNGRPLVTRLYRGARLSQPDEIDRPAVEHLEKLLSTYLTRNVRPDGRMVYLYYPSRGTEDRGRNNAIRQWMATLALCRIHRRQPESSLASIIERNIQYNLQTMYAVDNAFGVIDDRGRVKLGSVALAALALMESPFTQRYREVIDRLQSTLVALWQDSGKFRTFYQPSWRTGFQNFYSGEALLTWAARLSEDDDPTLMDRFLRSFQYYRTWHRQQRNPAFIPWHTQAYFRVWKQTGATQLRNFVFEMNDWLLNFQQWKNAPTPDTRGRFHDPQRPFGPPHASSTGVFLEGLIDAYALAQQVGDNQRADNYRTAIVRGLRSIHQLTFKDDVDMFYVGKRDRLRGGVRTTVYNNVVRVDNVQHNLMAIQKTLDSLCF